MPLDPQVRALLDAMEQEGLPPFEQMTPEQAREVIMAFKDTQAEPPPVARVEDRAIPGPTGSIPVRVYTPVDVPAGCALIVYYHGGGWVIGNLEVVDGPMRELASVTHSVVVSVDYRLAPEHKFPAAVDDCLAATIWAAEHATELGADPDRLVVMGDSAGGNLAAVIALLARDRPDGPRIAAQVLIYPVTDHTFDRASYAENADGYLLTREAMRWFWAHYLRTEQDGDDPRASPIRAADLGGLPPAFIATCEFDPLRDEGEAYAERLRAAGVPVNAARYDGMIHGFFWMTGAISRARDLYARIAAELERVARPAAHA